MGLNTAEACVVKPTSFFLGGREILVYKENDPKAPPIYWGISEEAHQLGIRAPQFFMQMPNKMTLIETALPDNDADELDGITSSTRSRVQLKSRSVFTQEILMEIMAEDEKNIAALVFQIKQCESIPSKDKFEVFLNQHVERIKSIPGNPNADCLRIPSRKALAKLYRPFKEGQIVTIDEQDHIKALEIQEQMLLAVDWIATCHNNNITTQEILKYLEKCFEKGQYPDLNCQPPINIERGSTKLTNSRKGGIQNPKLATADWF